MSAFQLIEDVSTDENTDDVTSRVSFMIQPDGTNTPSRPSMISTDEDRINIGRFSDISELKSAMRQTIGYDPTRYARKKTKSGMLVYTKSDSSVYPSYTDLTLPYRVICRQRYQNAINMHHAQFIKEIRLHERLQPYALGGVRIRREFCDPILHKVGQKDIIKLTVEEDRRLEYILKTDPIDL